MQIDCVISDNATNMDRMIAILGNDSLVTSFNGLSDQVRCFAHTISLSAKSAVSVFETKKKKNSATADDAIDDQDGNDDDRGDDEGSDDETGGAQDLVADPDPDLVLAEAPADGDLWLDELPDVSEEERAQILEAAKPVAASVSKV